MRPARAARRHLAQLIARLQTAAVTWRASCPGGTLQDRTMNIVHLTQANYRSHRAAAYA